MNAYPEDQTSSCRELHRTGSCHFFFKQLKDFFGAHHTWEAGTVVYNDLLGGFYGGETKPH